MRRSISSRNTLPASSSASCSSSNFSRLIRCSRAPKSTSCCRPRARSCYSGARACPSCPAGPACRARAPNSTGTASQSRRRPRRPPPHFAGSCCLSSSGTISLLMTTWGMVGRGVHGGGRAVVVLGRWDAPARRGHALFRLQRRFSAHVDVRRGPQARQFRGS